MVRSPCRQAATKSPSSGNTRPKKFAASWIEPFGMDRITGLTTEQRIRLTEMHEEWLEAGKSSEPLDRSAVAGIMADLYRRIHKPVPRVLVFSSPAMCLLAWAALTERRSA